MFFHVRMQYEPFILLPTVSDFPFSASIPTVTLKWFVRQCNSPISRKICLLFFSVEQDSVI